MLALANRFPFSIMSAARPSLAAAKLLSMWDSNEPSNKLSPVYAGTTRVCITKMCAWKTKSGGHEIFMHTPEEVRLHLQS